MIIGKCKSPTPLRLFSFPDLDIYVSVNVNVRMLVAGQQMPAALEALILFAAIPNHFPFIAVMKMTITAPDWHLIRLSQSTYFEFLIAFIVYLGIIPK